MASLPIPDCFADQPPVAGDVARGVTRLFCRQDLFAICEVPLPNGRRADMMAIDGKGQLAVGHVIANRASSGRYPSSYCGVVYQRGQFSFVRGHKMPPIARSGMQWKTAVAIAQIVDQKLQPTPVSKALFFHARHVSPHWRLTRVATLGNHVFYR